jgi:hypothetical protein
MVERRETKLHLAWYQNMETGLVRSFLWPPKRGKWKTTSLRTFHPTGKRVMARLREALAAVEGQE